MEDYIIHPYLRYILCIMQTNEMLKQKVAKHVHTQMDRYENYIIHITSAPDLGYSSGKQQHVI